MFVHFIRSVRQLLPLQNGFGNVVLLGRSFVCITSFAKGVDVWNTILNLFFSAPVIFPFWIIVVENRFVRCSTFDPAVISYLNCSSKLSFLHILAMLMNFHINGTITFNSEGVPLKMYFFIVYLMLLNRLEFRSCAYHHFWNINKIILFLLIFSSFIFPWCPIKVKIIDSLDFVAL